ncbi:MAG: oligosaccharide flippase family protein [Tissierellia bacterium]|nr:oligosaccharide flippase family protein [Tissierellia bacterium]
MEDNTQKTSTSNKNKRIAKNTLMLYFRQILILFVSLYTVRVVLDVLGAEDYGIYNVVAGVVTLLSFLSGTMASATQRFFSFALGRNDKLQLKKIFSVNILIYVFIAVIAFILLESIGFWFVKEKLDIPPDRFEAAIFIYHFAVLNFVVTILTSPFMAMIIAHEDMQIYAYVSIIEAVLKFGVVFLLMYINADKLELYGVLLFIVAAISAIIYISIAFKKYEECQFKKFYWDKKLVVEITGFTGWTLFGQISTVVRNQAVTILVNQFFNPVVVASRAIALSISSHVGVFANNFNTSLYPPIIKSYSTNNKNEMFSLIFNGSKLTFFLMWVISLPLLLELKMIFNIWLKDTPPDSVLFSQLKIIESLILAVSLPIATAARAPGKMKTYELTLGVIQLSIFLFSWIFLKMGYPAYSVFVVGIVINIIMFFVRLFIVSNLISLSVKEFMVKVVVPIIGVIIISVIPSYLIQQILPNGIIYSIIVILISVVTSSIAMFYIGLDKYWRKKIIGFVENKLLVFTKK